MKTGHFAIAAGKVLAGMRFTAGAVKTIFPRVMPPRAGGAPR